MISNTLWALFSGKLPSTLSTGAQCLDKIGFARNRPYSQSPLFMIATSVVFSFASLAQAQFVSLQYVTTEEEIAASGAVCLVKSEGEPVETDRVANEGQAKARDKKCYLLTNFRPLELVSSDQAPSEIRAQVQKHLRDFARLEVSQFALASLPANTTSTEVIPFFVKIRWTPKEIALGNLKPSAGYRGTVFAFGLLYINEFKSTDRYRIEMNEYASSGQLPRLYEGLVAQPDAFVFHQNNLFWLQNILAPVMLGYLKGQPPLNRVSNPDL